MKAVIQRVSKASVTIPVKNYYSEIGKGILVLLGIKAGDSNDDAVFVADKCVNLRIFEDEESKMNLSLKDVNGEVLLISQFTLYGDTVRGNRPGFINAAKPDEAIPLYDFFIKKLKENIDPKKVKTGIFGEMMDVQLNNYGPVTLIVESRNSEKRDKIV